MCVAPGTHTATYISITKNKQALKEEKERFWRVCVFMYAWKTVDCEINYRAGNRAQRGSRVFR